MNETKDSEIVSNLKKDPNLQSICDLLKKFDGEGKLFPRLTYSEDDFEGNLLKQMAKLELIHWCPYPEEFYVIWPRGKAALTH